MQTLLSLLGLLVAITVHEFSHALSADKLGDPTPKSQGRLTLNPLAHLDPIGTLMILFARFGWGKPVPIDPFNFRHPRRDELIVSLAGPASNLILAALLSIFVRLLGSNPQVLFYIIYLNVTLAVFNLLPIPPLDGSKIFLNLLPVDQSVEWEKSLSQYGPFILLALIFLPINGTNLINLVISPLIDFILSFLLV